jgi:DNA-binding response OmpR family regulator
MRISLPAVDPPALPRAPTPAEAVVANKTGTAPSLRALIIDDEPAITGLIEQFLESRGWRHLVLNDSTAVESNLDGQDFDLVICDLKMPGRNGLDVLRLLREKRPELAQRFLLMTGYLAEQEESGELSGVHILRKPFSLARLAEAMVALVPNGD